MPGLFLRLSRRLLKHDLSLHVLYRMQMLGHEGDCVPKFIQHQLEMVVVRLASHKTIDQSRLRTKKEAIIPVPDELISSPHHLTYSFSRKFATNCNCQSRAFSPSSHTLFLKSILKLPSHLHLGLAVRLFSCGSQIEILMQFTSVSSVSHVWPISSPR